MGKVWDTVLDLLFPPRCVFCRRLLRTGESGLCCACAVDLPFTADGGERRPDFIDKCVAPLYYEGAVRDSLLRYKFKGMPAYAGTYGRLMAGCCRERLKGRYDLVSWVPLSKQRLRERGYDQAMLVAMAMALELDTVAVETLRKDADAPPQSGAGDASARRDNISGAYSVPDRELVEGRRILLVDDIVTTGSTLSECARMLCLAGAESVVAACIACSRD